MAVRLDGFRGIANTIQSKKLNRLQRFEPLLDTLPAGYIFDGEIVALDEAGRPMFNALMFGRREPTHVALCFRGRQGREGHSAQGAQGAARQWRHGLQTTEPFIGEGRPLFSAVCKLDLEGIVAKRMAAPYGPQTRWWKIPNPTYSQKLGRAELFERQGSGLRYGRFRALGRGVTAA